MQSSQQERRRYFRVSDTLGLRYRLVNQEEAEAVTHESETQKRLAMLENQISAALEPLRSSQSELFDVLNLFNQKINLFYDMDGQHESRPRVISNVNLSACGIAFPIDESLALNELLVLDMILYPSHLSVSVQASVIACDPIEHTDQYLLRADFVELTESDQEVLVQHVIKCQSRQLKEARESRERSKDAKH